MKTLRTIGCIAAATTLALSGCSSSSDPGATGFLAVGITDAPVDEVLEVNVQFTGITLKPQNGDEIEIVFDQPRDIDLLTLTNGATAQLLPDTELPAGSYNWMRLAVNAEFDNEFDSYAVLPTGQVELRVPSGGQNGLRLVSGFTVLANSTTNLVIDWDLRKALTAPGGQPGLFLRPALRVTDMAEFGGIDGTVAAALVNDASCTNDLAADTGNAVYLYDAANATPGDIGDATTEPFATAAVSQDINGVYGYQFTFLPPGDYSVAFTCQASDDLVDTDEDIEFSAAQNVTVIDGATATVDF